jgi:hypothetical protein
VIRRFLLIAPLLVLLSTASSAQEDSARVDSAAAPAAAAADASSKNPTTATLLSIAPGGGQIYNEQYIKAGVFIGVGAYLAVQAVRLHSLFLDRAAQVDALPDDDESGARQRLRAEREFYRDNRDLTVAYFIGLQILSMIDAYVGAHLFDFDVGEPDGGLSSGLHLDPSRIGVGLSLRW